MKGSRVIALGAGVAIPAFGLLGQTKIIRDALADFFAERRERRAKQVAC